MFFLSPCGGARASAWRSQNQRARQEIRNPKSEIRNKPETNPNTKSQKRAKRFGKDLR
jgi:hypothetical protein